MTPAARILQTERLILRPFRESDASAYAEMCADDEVMRHLGGCLSPDDAWRQMAFFLGHWELRGYGMWALEERSTGELVGRLGHHHPYAWPGFEVGWALRRASWGKGYATEAGRKALEHAFEVMGVERVISLIVKENAPSIRLAERLGERRAGETVVRGVPVLVYAVGIDEWMAFGNPLRPMPR